MATARPKLVAKGYGLIAVAYLTKMQKKISFSNQVLHMSYF